jgi:hypothetical protein
LGAAHLCKNVKSAQVKVAKWQNFAQYSHTGHVHQSLQLIILVKKLSFLMGMFLV